MAPEIAHCGRTTPTQRSTRIPAGFAVVQRRGFLGVFWVFTPESPRTTWATQKKAATAHRLLRHSRHLHATVGRGPVQNIRQKEERNKEEVPFDERSKIGEKICQARTSTITFFGSYWCRRKCSSQDDQGRSIERGCKLPRPSGHRDTQGSPVQRHATKPVIQKFVPSQGKRLSLQSGIERIDRCAGRIESSQG